MTAGTPDRRPTLRRCARRFAAAVSVLAVALSTLPGQAAEKTLDHGRFGTITVYSESAQPHRVVLFVSGDGGWNQGVVDMARMLSTMDALVVGVDITHYLKALEAGDEACSYPAADFELLSKFVQQSAGYRSYVTPILVGYSSGATLVYALLVQAPPGTFAGAISLGFCPDLPLKKPMCHGNGLESAARRDGKGVDFLPVKQLEAPWIALQGQIDQVCSPAGVDSFAARVHGAEVVRLPGVGHGFSVLRHWAPQFRQAFDRIAAASAPRTGGDSTGTTSAAPAAAAASAASARSAAEVSATPSLEQLRDLPLTEVPAGAPSDPQDSWAGELAVILSGDGGWSITERGISHAFAQHGVAVVGLSSLQYFWQARTPEQAAADLARILRGYLAAWHKQSILLLGYSMGADVLPFMVNRLPADLVARIRAVALLGPSHYAEFEFHFSEWFRSKVRPTSLPVRPEVEKLRGRRLICLYGASEKDSLCPELPPELAQTVELPGGHLRWTGIAATADSILARAR